MKDVEQFYQNFKKRLKQDQHEDIDDMKTAIDSAELISKELKKHDFDKIVINPADSKQARELARQIHNDMAMARKRYNMLRRIIKNE